jgi:hypothetical protein
LADAIFISYRRDDSEGEAGRLFDDLTRAFGNDAVFMDVTGIQPGVDFRRAIEKNVASCGVLLAIIGPSWLTVTNAEGTRRLDDPSDFVALEIASAMKRDVPVIPVLVHEAKMPAVNALPETLKDLAFHNSVELSHARWSSDVALLVEALQAYVTPSLSSPQNPAAPVHATVPVQLPAPHPPTEGMALPPSGSKMPLIAGVTVVVMAVAGGVVYFATRPSPAQKPVESAPIAAVTGAVSASPSDTPASAQNPGPALAAATPATVPESTARVNREKPTIAPAASPIVPAAPKDPNAAYLGTWKRSVAARNGDTLGMLVLSQTGDGLTMHAFGSCQAPVCDWGSQPAVSDGNNLSATFSPAPSGSDTSRTAHVITHVVPAGLDVTIQNSFVSPAGARHNSAHTLFVSVK